MVNNGVKAYWRCKRKKLFLYYLREPPGSSNFLYYLREPLERSTFFILPPRASPAIFRWAEDRNKPLGPRVELPLSGSSQKKSFAQVMNTVAFMVFVDVSPRQEKNFKSEHSAWEVSRKSPRKARSIHQLEVWILDAGKRNNIRDPSATRCLGNVYSCLCFYDLKKMSDGEKR